MKPVARIGVVGLREFVHGHTRGREVDNAATVLNVLKNGERVQIRPFSTSDILPLHRMYRSLSQQSRKFCRPPFFEFKGPKWFLSNLSLLLATFSAVRRLLAHFFSRAVSPSLVAVNAKNELIGFTYLIGNDSKTGIGIFVRDDYQNAGLGSRLLDLAVALARKERIHARAVYGWILIENTRAIHLVEKYGFKAVHRANGDLVVVFSL